MIPFEAKDLDFLRSLAQQEKISYFNCRLFQSELTSLAMLNQVSRSCNSGLVKGISIQTFSEGGWGLASGNTLDRSTLEQIFLQSAKLARWSGKLCREKFSISPFFDSTTKFQAPFNIALDSVGPDEKIRNLSQLEQSARDVDPKIVSTEVHYSDTNVEKVIYNSNGGFVRLNQPHVHISVQAIAKDGSNQQKYHASYGGVGGFELFKQAIPIAPQTAKDALELLGSKPVKPGLFDIIMDPKLTGTFIHEAFGHACEADAVLSGESLLAGKLDQPVGPDLISIIDDGSLPGSYGWVPFDDEGNPGQKTELVSHGVLKNYLHSVETASKMKTKPTGNARAQGYSLPPIVRMTNTYISPGDWNLDELIRDMKNGLLCLGWQYGYTDPVDGSFMFKMAKAYHIQNGEKKQLYRDAAISGQTLDVLQRIDGLSHQIEMDPGHCGKEGQSAAVTSGGPYTRIRKMVIGGQ